MVVLCWASPYLGVNEFYYFFISVLNYRVGWVFYKASRYNPQQNRYLYQHKGHTEPVQSSPSAICFCFVCFLQAVIMENEVLPKIFLDFLNIRHFPSVPKTESCGSFDTESEGSSKLSHQPVMLFLRDPYLLPSARDAYSNMVIEGVIHGIFYPDLQPR